MRERVCKNCGGRSYKVVGQNMVKCRFCGTLYVDEHASKEEEVLVIGANEIARALRFEDAVDEFNKIITVFPMSFEGYFGRVLARNKIVLYPSKRGSFRSPRFFAEPVNISEDVDFKKAIELAPEETAKTYFDLAKKIEKYKKQYEESNQEYDVVFAPSAADKDSEYSSQLVTELKKTKKVFFLPEQGDKEPYLFKALKTSKIVILSNEKNGDFSEFKNIFDRYFYFVTQKKKTYGGLIIAIDESKTQKKDLPKEFLNFNIISVSQPIEEVVDLVSQQAEKAEKEVAKIDTITLSNEEPKRKKQVEVESITPIDLGHYEVENIALSDANKVEWIFLLLKNGDFETAEQLIGKELSKDENNARLLFARLMCSKRIKTEEDFFSTISNFQELDKIETILKYASKDFAEDFVDKFEALIMKWQDIDNYKKYLLFLAGFDTPHREEFILAAENLAVETMDEQLIDMVQKCFDPNDVDRFINLYYLLAQKSGDQRYYDKILSLDQGHEQSNMTKFLEHFNTPEQILSYHDREEIEGVFKYLSENSRANFVTRVVDMVLPIAYKDLDAAEQQLDFYLSYITNVGELCACLKKIADSFQQMRFFKQAEKYISIAISKDNSNADLYWNLIKIKAHCVSDGEVVTSPVKFSDFPEWESMVSASDEKQREKYAEVISRNNLFKGERSKFLPDMLDEKMLKQKLAEFLSRNEKILLEMNSEHGLDVKRRIDYYTLQLKPLQQILEEVGSSENYQEFADLSMKVAKRMTLLDLTFDSSISVLSGTDRDEGLKQIYAQQEEQEKRHQKQLKKIREDKFLKRYLCGFLEFFPICFLTMLLTFAIFLPKETFGFFSQDFLIISVVCTSVIALANIIFYFLRRKKTDKRWQLVNIVLFAFGIVNLILFVVGFYIFPNPIKISNAKELQLYIQNANCGRLELSNDIDMKGASWESGKFSGQFDGKNHKLTNVNVSGGIFAQNSGTIKNLQVELAQTISKQKLFGGVAQINSGKIENCIVTGTVTIQTDINSVIGGLVAEERGGSISNCESNLVVTIEATDCEIVYGGLIGQMSDLAKIFQNLCDGSATISGSNCKICFGGLIGKLDKVSGHTISQNAANVSASFSGTATEAEVGGLIGYGMSNSDNNYTTGRIKASDFTCPKLNIGGLYGDYQNANNPSAVEYSFSTITIDAAEGASFGGLFGRFNGSVKNCFSSIKPIGSEGNYTAGAGTCLQSDTYQAALNFSSKIWALPQDGTSAVPKLVWQKD